MVILLGFAVLAGAGTALSPCVLPVLPALLASGGAGGRRRPLGVVLGLSLTFAITIVGIAKVADGVGLGSDPLRAVAVVVLLGAGAVLLIPRLGERIEARMSRMAAFGPRSRGDGFRSGLLVGAALGFVYTPCAGPILAAVISVGAATGRSVAVGIAYTLGSAAVLLALTLGGRTIFERVRAAGRGPALQRTLGAIMVATALIIITGEDVRFDQYIAQHIPEVNLTATLEKSHAVESRLHEITGRKARFTASVGTPVAVHGASQATLLADARKLPALATAPEFKETEDWFNTGAGGHSNTPLTLAGLRGRVVLVDFWTYTCINCIRTLPYLKAWNAAYRNEGLTIVGVETPEFSFEHDAANVASAISTFGIKYPVVQDNEYGTWDAYNNEYWPADYLIDAHGHVRYVAFGEGDYDKTESAIRALLAEAGYRVGGKGHPSGVIVPSDEATPETYLGTARAQGWVNGPVGGEHDYGSGTHPNLELDTFAYTGTWNISEQPAVAGANAGLEANVQGRHVYLVLSSAGKVPRHVEVLLEGRRIPAADAGADVHNGIVTVRGERLYTLVSLPHDEHHHLTLRFEPGVTGYAFTFG
ncbi:MAG TPA: cytochrome c biogenesis protein DipZ [Solirubrobacteraceae bacterium]|jgi:cytochrome c biogenesis protein CcdA/thiol-disulfide isomerase/thioredoxin|nr:cytochrome c biogenesis protein DipZ [Solirubrobacteraceae bacterium]